MFAKARFGILLLFIFSGFAFSQNPGLDAGQILELVNGKRQEHGLASLRLNPVLNLAAFAKASDMQAFNYFAHVSPQGVRPWHWFKALGYKYVYAGENLAVGFSDPSELIDSWMSSATHRANILSPFYSDLGLAIVGEGDNTLVVQFFGNKNQTLISLRQ